MLSLRDSGNSQPRPGSAAEGVDLRGWRGQGLGLLHSPEYLQQRRNLPGELVKNIAGIEPLLQKVVG